MTDILLESASPVASVTLPGDLLWSDEFTGWKVGQAQRRSLTGALIVQESEVQVGRPITLQTTRSGNSYVAAVSLPVLQALQALEAVARTTPMTLTLPAHNSGTRTFNALWNRAAGAALEATPLLFASPYVDGDYFAITLRLITTD
jgi:hypothetical protein